MKVETWLPIASFVVAALGPVTAWITLRYNAAQARKERFWHERKEIYIDALRFVQQKQSIEAGERFEDVVWSYAEKARLRAFASDAVLNLWGGHLAPADEQLDALTTQIRKDLR